MSKQTILFICIVLYVLSIIFDVTNTHASNRTPSLDSLKYDSLDSIYLRESDYDCIYLLDSACLFGCYYCTITPEKADSIITARKNILRKNKH